MAEVLRFRTESQSLDGGGSGDENGGFGGSGVSQVKLRWGGDGLHV